MRAVLSLSCTSTPPVKLQDLVQALDDKCTTLFPGCQSLNLFLHNLDTNKIWLCKARETDGQKIKPFPPGQGIVGSVVELRKAVLCDNTTVDPRYMEQTDGVMPSGSGCLLVPVMDRHSRVLAALQVVGTPGLSFSSVDGFMLETVGQWVGSVLHWFHIKDGMINKFSKTTTRVFEHLTRSGEDLQKQITNVCASLQEVASVDSATVWRVDTVENSVQLKEVACWSRQNGCMPLLEPQLLNAATGIEAACQCFRKVEGANEKTSSDQSNPAATATLPGAGKAAEVDHSRTKADDMMVDEPNLVCIPSVNEANKPLGVLQVLGSERAIFDTFDKCVMKLLCLFCTFSFIHGRKLSENTRKLGARFLWKETATKQLALLRLEGYKSQQRWFETVLAGSRHHRQHTDAMFAVADALHSVNHKEVDMEQGHSAVRVDPTTMAGAFVRACRRTLRADKTTVYQWKPETHTLVSVFSELYPSGGKDEIVIQVRGHDRISLAGMAATQKCIVNAPVAVQHQHFSSAVDQQTGYHTISALAVPMYRKTGEVMGVVELLNKQVVGLEDEKTLRFTDLDADLMQALVEQFSIALENANLMEQTSALEIQLQHRTQQQHKQRDTVVQRWMKASKITEQTDKNDSKPASRSVGKIDEDENKPMSWSKATHMSIQRERMKS